MAAAISAVFCGAVAGITAAASLGERLLAKARAPPPAPPMHAIYGILGLLWLRPGVGPAPAGARRKRRRARSGGATRPAARAAPSAGRGAVSRRWRAAQST